MISAEAVSLSCVGPPETAEAIQSFLYLAIMYDEYKIYGPYLCKDGRLRLVLYDGENRKTLSYPKYLMELHLGRKLLDNEEVHHIDENPINNDISNLEVKDGGQHSRDHFKNTDIEILECKWCGCIFEAGGKKLKSLMDSRRKGKFGPFCSRSCAGKWSTR